MEKKQIEQTVQKALHLPTTPSIKWSQKRLLSRLYELKAGDQTYILKIPKQAESINGTPPHISEWQALKYFYELTNTTDSPVHFVKPVAPVEALGGFVMEKVGGRDFYPNLRRTSLSNKRHNEEVVFRLGQGIAWLHRHTGQGQKSGQLDVPPAVGNEQIDKSIREIFASHPNFSVNFVLGMPGFSLRDALLTKDDKLSLLDPVSVQEEPSYKVVAKCIANLKLLHQGTPLFPFFRTESRYESAFLRGYFGAKNYDRQLLGIFILDTTIRYYTGVTGRLFKNPPLGCRLIAVLIRDLYLKPPYRREIRNVIEKYGL